MRIKIIKENAIVPVGTELKIESETKKDYRVILDDSIDYVISINKEYCKLL